MDKIITITKKELDNIIQEHIVAYHEKLIDYLTMLREEIEKISFDTTFCLNLLLSDFELNMMYKKMKNDYEKALNEQTKESEKNVII